LVSNVVIPDLGATDSDLVLDEWLVKTGDFVKSGMPIFVVTTDKATVEVEAFRDGFIRDILVSAGDTVPVGEVIAIMTDSIDEPLNDVVQKSVNMEQTKSRDHVLASPLARRIAKELGMDISSIKGSGPKGRIQKKDVLSADKLPIVSVSNNIQRETADRRIPVSPMRKAIAKRTSRSKTEAPHFYVSTMIDMTETQLFRKQIGAIAEKNGWSSPSISDIAIKASALALRQIPDLNASFRGNEIIYFDNINIGLVIGLSEGIIVPVIHNADKKNLYTIAKTTKHLRDRALVGKLSDDDLSGSTFTISNIGMFGVDSFIAVINPPEAAILALGAIRLQPAVWENQVVPREIMTATLSADHRLVDGITAAKFLGTFREILENPIGLTLEPPEENVK
jgi:pyruvate dehydrogenase E2 component (dihydrolipoamide acetyltransferase)